MQARNPRYTSTGDVDLEVEHPTLGWIPFTASPNDSEEHGRALYQAAVDGEFGEIAQAEEEAVSIESLRSQAVLSRMEFMLALEDMGELDRVQSADLPKRARIMFDNASEFARNHESLLSLADEMGYTEQQLDTLFGIET